MSYNIYGYRVVMPTLVCRISYGEASTSDSGRESDVERAQDASFLEDAIRDVEAMFS